MPHPAVARPVSLRTRRRRLLALGVGLAVLLATASAVMVHANFAAVAAPFAPTAEDGLITEGTVVTFADEEVPAIARLDPALRDAMTQAESDAGMSFRVTSGWRSERYQQWLLEDAIELYASEVVARQYVATPDRSSHVTGRAVDIAPLDAQFWLMEHGARYGICQTYANERWHFERATEPGGVCPEMQADAAS